MPQKVAALQLDLQPLVDKGAVVVKRLGIIYRNNAYETKTSFFLSAQVTFSIRILLHHIVKYKTWHNGLIPIAGGVANHALSAKHNLIKLRN